MPCNPFCLFRSRAVAAASVSSQQRVGQYSAASRTHQATSQRAGYSPVVLAAPGLTKRAAINPSINPSIKTGPASGQVQISHADVAYGIVAEVVCDENCSTTSDEMGSPLPSPGSSVFDAFFQEPQQPRYDFRDGLLEYEKSLKPEYDTSQQQPRRGRLNIS